MSKAETDQADYRHEESANVFFGPEKHIYFGSEKNRQHVAISVLYFNTVVLLAFTGVCLGLLHASLRRQLSTKA